MQSRLLTPLVWLLSKRVPVAKDFGPFNGMRADAAFDAAYMYCRVAMAGTDDVLRHPHPAVLTGAALRLDWSLETMAKAMSYLEHWYDPLRKDYDPYNELLAIALRLQTASDTKIHA